MVACRIQASSHGACVVDLHKSPGRALNAKVHLIKLHEVAKDVGAGRVPSPQEQLALLPAEMKTKRPGQGENTCTHACMHACQSMVLNPEAWTRPAGSAAHGKLGRRLVPRDACADEW